MKTSERFKLGPTSKNQRVASKFILTAVYRMKLTAAPLLDLQMTTEQSF